MTCRAVRRSLPLLAGDDLGSGKTAKVRAHIAACDACRLEAATYAAARAVVRTFAREDRPPAWTEPEWRAAVRAAAGAVPAERKRTPVPRLRPVPAYVLAIALAAAGVVAVLHKTPHRAPGAALAGISSSAAELAGPIGPELRRPAGPHLTTIRFNLKDGSIKVVWFFNRDFKTDFYGK
jgi:anti-sigma factor RsiW